MTSQRRPHWDDDLVDAVIDLQYHCVDCMEDDYPDIDQRDPDAANKAWAHAIIAAVEDWQSCQAMINISASTYAMTVGRTEDAKAVIQQVREVCDKPTMRTTDISGVTEWVRVRDIESALDGTA